MYDLTAAVVACNGPITRQAWQQSIMDEGGTHRGGRGGVYRNTLLPDELLPCSGVPQTLVDIVPNP